MKFLTALSALCLIVGTVAVVQAEPLRKRNANYDNCVKEHGAGHWKPAGKDSCNGQGYCFCDEKTGGIGCVC
ncbi:hypothetical protein DL89DRAFT_266548 [Linderina pennispora]|uniref:Invertebrate defensins family profile domain-containing protein n=1 Tax=Linderina pennispora TaxID=61395 RepID=A0A1Y1WDE5_9FUNG|nr:uncharacterized protein DL89DRAFT_266548 [Linderina pennispora]ORX71549.1 hypothetical protein DL89DRAFT_266548 [Linderina pennispora]